MNHGDIPSHAKNSHQYTTANPVPVRAWETELHVRLMARFRAVASHIYNMRMEQHLSQQTIAFYDEHAGDFIADTFDADMSAQLSRFLMHVPAGGTVLDWGCGSGRDAKAMLEAGYSVTASDASCELCNRAERLIGLPVRNERFLELTDKHRYDGIWACSSLLHLTPDELPCAFFLAHDALKPGGVLYVSFKYGTSAEMRNGRWFTDRDESALEALLPENLAIIDIWTSSDVRPKRRGERWLNAIIRKKS